MSSKALAPSQVETVGSHFITVEPWGKASKEECYPVLTATWRGREVRVQFQASRYVTSDEQWTEWRVYATTALDPVTDTARRAINEACTPVVMEWLASDAYAASRQVAFAHAIARAIRDEHVGGERVRRTFETHKHELSDADRERLGSALDHMEQMYALLST